MNAPTPTTTPAPRRLYRARVYRQGPRHLKPEDKGVIAGQQIEAVLLSVFRCALTTVPTFVHVDNGRAAEAWDDHGNRVRVVQVNSTR